MCSAAVSVSEMVLGFVLGPSCVVQQLVCLVLKSRKGLRLDLVV